MNESTKNIVISAVIAAVVSVGVALAFKQQHPAGEASSGSANKEEVEGIVRTFIDEHPDVIIDSLNKMQQRKLEEQQAQAKDSIKTKGDDLYKDPNSPVAGNPKGDVTLVEFFDYNCGFCKKMLPPVTELIKQDKNLKVVFKEFPILSPSSEQAARAALAVYHINKEKFFDYHSALMSHNGNKDMDTLVQMAKDIGIDADKLKKEMENKDITDQINKNKMLAQNLGVRGTPAFIIGDDLIPGAVDTAALKAKIDETRAKNK